MITIIQLGQGYPWFTPIFLLQFEIPPCRGISLVAYNTIIIDMIGLINIPPHFLYLKISAFLWSLLPP